MEERLRTLLLVLKRKPTGQTSCLKEPNRKEEERKPCLSELSMELYKQSYGTGVSEASEKVGKKNPIRQHMLRCWPAPKRQTRTH